MCRKNTLTGLLKQYLTLRHKACTENSPPRRTFSSAVGALASWFRHRHRRLNENETEKQCCNYWRWAEHESRKLQPTLRLQAGCHVTGMQFELHNTSMSFDYSGLVRL